MFRYSTESHRGNIKSYFPEERLSIASTCRQPASFGRLLIILQHRGFGWGLFDAHAYRGAGDGWGYPGLGLSANRWQEPFDRAALKTGKQRDGRPSPAAKPADRRAHRATPLPWDRVFGVPQPMAFERCRRRARLISLHRVGGPEPAASRCPRNCSRNRLTADRFERAAVSQIRVATKTIVPVVKFQDFLCNGGVYEEAGWIAST